ncbi:GPI anchored cell wall protein [Apiospora arundinis]|uniref:GPI anchored cell wall protein n=1 Tax=Apiospora arundinis TaxID=335852 RepID=A0ABR2JBT5_9PEZI
MPGNFLRLAALAGGANALALRAADGGCEMTMSTSGSVSYPVSQHGSGQTKAGQGLPPTTFKMDGNGGLTDANGRGCWWTPPTNVLQCDVGQPPAGGFKVDCSGQVTYQGSSTFYQCKVPGDKDKSVNIYNKPNQGQDCKEIKLNANGNSCKPASCTNTNTVPPGYGVQTPPAPPASTVTVPGSAPPAPPPQTVTVPGSAPPAQTVTVPGSAPPAKTVTVPGSAPPAQTVTVPGSAPPAPPPQTVTIPGSAPPAPPAQTVYSTVPGSAPPAPPAKTVTVPGPAPPPQTVTGQCPAPPAPQTVTGQCPTPPAPQTVTVNGPAPPAATVTGQCPAPPPAQTITVNGPAPPAATVTGQCPAPPPAQTVTVNGPAPPAATVTGQCPAPPAPQTVTVTAPGGGNGYPTGPGPKGPATTAPPAPESECPPETPGTGAPPAPTGPPAGNGGTPPGNGGNGGKPPGNGGNGGKPPGNGGNGGSPPGNGNGGSPPAQQSPPAQPTTLKPVPSSPTGGYPTQPTGGNGNGGNTPGQGGNGGGNGGNGGPPPNQVNIPGSCPGGVRNAGELTLPNLIIPVDSTQPQKKAGTSFNGQVSSTISSVFNFDIPASLKGKTCTVKFLFPEKKTLETSDFSFSGSGALDFSKLSKGVDQSASYATLPSGTSMGSQTVKPGNAYTVGSFPCPGGDSVAIKMSGSGSTSLTFFEDYNPCPIGLFITTS